MPIISDLPFRFILGMRVDPTTYGDTLARVMEWAAKRESRYICIATVNNVMQARESEIFRRAMNAADLVTPDGMPLVWGLRLLGLPAAGRVYGPDLMPIVMEAAARAGIPIGFYGGADDSRLSTLISACLARFPQLDIAYAYSPPFRPLTPTEDAELVDAISRSGVRILFVGLSTPKQDLWMAEHRCRIPAVMLGVGAAFDFMAGVKRQAPRWMMPCGLEWAFRLATEPRRLWRRYLKQNPLFAVLFILQMVKRGCSTRRNQAGDTCDYRQ